MPSIASLLSVVLFSVLPVLAKQCVQFDTGGNLHVFGGPQDYNLGASSSWASPSPQALTTNGRPPWTGNNTLCSLSQYNNALYVLDGDSSNPGDIYIYDFAAASWSKQTTTSPPDLSTGSSVLDHDTNVYLTLPGSTNTIYSLDMNAITNKASSSAIAWSPMSSPNFALDGRQPVMSQASNHIIFFNVPANPAGSANMFVIHYSYFQPEVQAFALANGATTNFPTSHGQAISVPLSNNDAGDQVIFIPDDFSNTYVVTHWTNPSNYALTSDAPSGIVPYINSTQTLPAPSAQDVGASYAASDTTLVQFASNGDIYYLPSAFGNGWAVSTSATWQKLNYSVAGLSGTVSTASSAASSSAASGTASNRMSTAAAGTSGQSQSMRAASSSGASPSATSGTGAAGRTSSNGLVSTGLIAGLAGIFTLGAGLLL